MTDADADRPGLGEYFPEVYDELKALAGAYLKRERAGHTLQPTALVNEAYLRLTSQDAERWNDREHFYRIAAMAMRRVLIDHARTKARVKRGGGAERVSLDEAEVPIDERAAELVALDEALSELAVEQARKAEIVELRFFGGLSLERVAEVIACSPATVKREWAVARAWLLDRMSS